MKGNRLIGEIKGERKRGNNRKRERREGEREREKIYQSQVRLKKMEVFD